MRRLSFVLVVATIACVPAQDDPSHVHDLRVLAIQLDPPELMAPECPTPDGGVSLQSLIAYAQPVRATALIVDPKGGGRSVHYELFGCASTGDKTCANLDTQYLFASGDTAPDGGEFWMTPEVDIAPGFATDSSGNPLLLDVLQQDPYQGLGGIRMPLVLHIAAGSEEIYAQKLMVFSCRFFPDMQPNQNPGLPGMQVNGLEWNDGGITLQGAGPFTVQPDDYSALVEHYVVPALDLSRVELTESWKVAWYTDVGTFGPSETGGVDLGGQEGQNISYWSPDSGVAQDAHFWFTVRDGRGGMSWLMRTAQYLP